MDGDGGIRRENSIGYVQLTGSNNTYTGPTIIDDNSVFVGLPFGESGWFGSGVVTNNGSIYIDRGGVVKCSNDFYGKGAYNLRYGLDLTLDGSTSSNRVWRVGDGALTLTNNTVLKTYEYFALADRNSIGYGNKYTPDEDSPIITNLNATLNIHDGCLLESRYIVMGNGRVWDDSTLTGVVNQVGGTVRTTGYYDAEHLLGLRLGHWPPSRVFYNMQGGVLSVTKGYDLACATDGQGWLKITGGEVDVKRITVKQRDNSTGFGRLSLIGGVLSLGSDERGSEIGDNGIITDTASYLVELGGDGGTVRAATDIRISTHATLVESGSSGVNFDSNGNNILITGDLSGDGGFNKVGAGNLVLAGAGSFTGEARIMQGNLIRDVESALPSGSTLYFGVSESDDGGRIHSDDDLSLAGLRVGVANPESLDLRKTYTIATWEEGLSAPFDGLDLPGSWYVQYDIANKKAVLRADVGTRIILK